MNQRVALAVLTLVSLMLAAVPSGSAAVVTPGNLLVSDNGTNMVTEYTTNGSFVQSFSVAPNATFGLRDVVVDEFGSIHLFNGTFSPVLSTIDPVSGVQTDRNADFSTANVLGYGGIASTAGRVFVNDSNTSGSPDNGLISWEIGGGFTPTRFATDFAANDLTVGQDGQLYALGLEDTSTGLPARYVNVYDPQTLTRTEQIDLLGSNAPAGLRALTAG